MIFMSLKNTVNTVSLWCYQNIALGSTATMNQPVAGVLGGGICLPGHWGMGECLRNLFGNRHYFYISLLKMYYVKALNGYSVHLSGVGYHIFSIYSLHYFLIWLPVRAYFFHSPSHSFCLPSFDYFCFIIYSVCPLFFLLFSPLLFFILNTAWQSILKSQEGCSFPFAQWGDPLVCQLKEWNKRSL